MTDPIVTLQRVSERPVRWLAAFVACGVGYDLQVTGFGSTPELAWASGAANMDRVKMHMLVASLAFKNRVPEMTEGAEG